MQSFVWPSRSEKSTKEHSPGVLNVFLDLQDNSRQQAPGHIEIGGDPTLTRKVTASLPSSRRWSYVRARYIICCWVSNLNANVRDGHVPVVSLPSH